MQNVKYNSPADSSDYSIKLLQRIRDLGRHGDIQQIDCFSYITNHIIRRDDSESQLQWKCMQNILDLSRGWFSQLDESRQKNLNIYYSNVSPFFVFIRLLIHTCLCSELRPGTTYSILL
jgi:hypothetical protein